MEGITRRTFLRGAGATGAALAAGAALPSLPAFAGPGSFFTTDERTTLDAALARMIPAERPGDWSAADVGAGDYIERLLMSFDEADQRIYAGGPTREHFHTFQELTRVKELGWRVHVTRLRDLYRGGLLELDRRAGGGKGETADGTFAERPAPVQDAILETLDHEDAPFFEALYHHTMEGTYAHPVYRGNDDHDYRPWDDLRYQGDVHGRRFPDQLHADDDLEVSDGSWNENGGYAPEEMILPGPNEGSAE